MVWIRKDDFRLAINKIESLMFCLGLWILGFIERDRGNILLAGILMFIGFLFYFFYLYYDRKMEAQKK